MTTRDDVRSTGWQHVEQIQILGHFKHQRESFLHQNKAQRYKKGRGIKEFQ
jgi:hypothetical protein